MVEYSRLERRGREKYLDKAVLDRRGYVRRKFLGQGTFSDVYCVEDGAGRTYACKVSEKKEMLEREAKAMERLSHPLFPKYADFWTEGSLGILIREYISGSCLEELLGRRHFSVEHTVRIGLWLAEGLGYLHRLPERLLFRDVKPANIIIRQDGGVMLIDLGCVCSMEEATSRAGSPGFAAPEQLQGGGILTAACDVYGLGRTLEAVLGLAEGCSQRNGHMSSGCCWPGSPEGEPYRLRAGLERAGRIVGRRRTGLRKPGERRRRGAWREQGTRRKLLRVLETCTEEKAENRIADMDEVGRELRGILRLW